MEEVLAYDKNTHTYKYSLMHSKFLCKTSKEFFLLTGNQIILHSAMKQHIII